MVYADFVELNVLSYSQKGGPSKVQTLQMTTVSDKNIHCVAVNGDFDDCQAIVKKLNCDLEFKRRVGLGAVNSINWARILAQIVYYFYAYFTVCKDASTEISFSVPTGNFGDILAGWYAKKMGLPVAKLVVATNSNDILDRFFRDGKYHKSGSRVTATPAPSMDISVSSNFERFLCHVGQDTGKAFGENQGTHAAVRKTRKLPVDPRPA